MHAAESSLIEEMKVTLASLFLRDLKESPQVGMPSGPQGRFLINPGVYPKLSAHSQMNYQCIRSIQNTPQELSPPTHMANNCALQLIGKGSLISPDCTGVTNFHATN
jgi:hypothetical protein